MQLFQQPFDASQVKPQDAFEPIPDGWYNLAIRSSETKPTKDNESGYLSFEIEVLDGEYKGRKLFDLLNLWNKNPQAVEIAQRQLSAYCHATGVMLLQHSEQLHGIPFKGKVSTKHDQGYEPRNVIKTVKHIQEVVQSAAPASHAPGGFPGGLPQAPVTAPTATPFGQNPTLPQQPQGGFVPPTQQQPAQGGFVPPQQAAPAMPWHQPQPTGQNFAQNLQQPQQPGSWGQSSPASAAPGAPTGQLPPAFAQQPQQPVPQPQNGPVPPWRK